MNTEISVEYRIGNHEERMRPKLAQDIFNSGMSPDTNNRMNYKQVHDRNKYRYTFQCAMKTHWACGGRAPYILNYGNTL